MGKRKNTLKSPNNSCDFIKVTQAQPINALMRARKQEYDAPSVDFYTQDRSFECGSNRDILVRLPPLKSSCKFSESTKKTLGFLLQKFQETQAQDLAFPLREYCEVCKLSKVDHARNTLIKDLNLISETSLMWEGYIPTKNKKTGKSSKPSKFNPHPVEIIKTGSFKKEKSDVYYHISFSDEFYKLLKAWGFMYVPASLFQYSLKHYPYIFALGWSLCAHLNMNQKGNEWGCLTMDSVLDCAGIPTYQEEKANNWKYRERIKEPVTKTLDELSNLCGLAYYYSHQDGTPISKEEEDQILSLDYPIEKFIKLKIYFSFPNMPQHDHAKKGKSANKKKKASTKESKESSLFFMPYESYFLKNLSA